MDADSEPRVNSQAPFVAFSMLGVADVGRGDLEIAFADRLGKVDEWPGFRRLEVWSDLGDPGGYVMVSWWDSAAAFESYMRSDEHRESHARIPKGDARPRPRHFRRYAVIAN